jgi:leader peptidase (prepilin peptidase)/N-methyltransferase
VTAAAALVWAAAAVWAVLGVYVSITDLRSAIIPRRAVWAAGLTIAALLGAAAGLLATPLRFAWAVVGAASLALVLEVIYRRWPGRIGFGDVRLIIVGGLLAGWWGVAWSWWALCAGAVAEWPVALVVLVREGRHARVRWAPGLVVGTAAVLAYRLATVGPTG